MKITQVYEILNKAYSDATGKTDVTITDTSDLVDIGTEIFDTNTVDAYVKSLVNHIGRVIFVNRTYSGWAPSIMMDGWEFGSVLEKIDIDVPESEKNESWDLQNGERYDQDIFNSPTAVQKFFNSKVTYEVAMSFADRQVKQSFSNQTQLLAFFAAIENKIQMRLTIDYDNLKMLTIGNFIGATVRNAYGTTTISGSSYTRARNLLYEYNQLIVPEQTALTAENCFYDLGCLKFAAKEISLCSARMVTASQMFNIGGRIRHTSKDLQHIVLHSDFAKAADVYLQSDTFHNELTKLPNAETVPYWQGSGKDFSFTNTGKVALNIVDPANPTSKVNQTVTGVIGVIFDRDAAAVCNVDNRVTSHRNNRAEFVNNWYKSEAQYLNDYNENFVVFFVA